MIYLPTARSTWKVVFAVTALIEFRYILLLMRKINDDNVNGPEPDFCQPTLVYYEDNEFSINYTFIDRAWESTITITQLVFVWAGPFFCCLCLVEALVRAVEARNAACDNRALDDLEKSLLLAAQKSTTRLSMFFTGAAADNAHKKSLNKKVSKALRSFIPAIITIAFWLFILPTDISDFHHQCGTESLNDSAAMTQWINRMSISLSKLGSAVNGLIESFFWTKILPYRIHKEPQRFIQRIQVILRWIRFLRFAGPLFRMGMKLQDQIRAVWKARRQYKKSDMEKQRRVDRPSMIFSDIQKLTQLAKDSTAMARVPSFRLLSSPVLNKFSASVVETYKKRRVFGKNVSDQLAKLQSDYLTFGSTESFTATSDLYDRIVKLSQEIALSIQSDKGNYSNRYIKSLRSLFSSREHLISPRTRFSLAWRITVTNCLMLEIARLCASWYLSETFSIPLSQIVGRLLVDCKAPEETKHHLSFITDQLNRFQRHMFDTFPIFGQAPVDIACIPNGPQALLILHFGRMLEIFVDVVVFTDIFVWFFTGDIDIDTLAIIPKPFFTRCILPGTLVQVLDHPTLPDLLPGLLKNTISAFSSIGYSRSIRWILALIPALKILVIEPMTGFFFKHIEEDEGLMHYAESVGMLTPERKSGMLYGSTDSLGIGPGSLFRRLSTNAYNTSQVGMAYDTSPTSSNYNFQESMASTEGSTTDDAENLPSSLDQPTFSGMRMENSALKSRKSVHFGLFTNNENQPVYKEHVYKEDIGLHLSPASTKSVHFGLLENANQAAKKEIDKNVENSLNSSELQVSSSFDKSLHFSQDNDRQGRSIKEEIAKDVGYSLSSSELQGSPSYDKSVHFGEDDDSKSGSSEEEIARDVGYRLSSCELQGSPSYDKSVHFGEDDDNKSESNEEEIARDVGYRLSSCELRGSPSYDKSVHFGQGDDGNSRSAEEEIARDVGYSLSSSELQGSPSNAKSVHFGEDDVSKSRSTTEDAAKDVGYSLSSSELQGSPSHDQSVHFGLVTDDENQYTTEEIAKKWKVLIEPQSVACSSIPH